MHPQDSWSTTQAVRNDARYNRSEEAANEDRGSVQPGCGRIEVEVVSV